jgi:hypothetical protein
MIFPLTGLVGYLAFKNLCVGLEAVNLFGESVD